VGFDLLPSMSGSFAKHLWVLRALVRFALTCRFAGVGLFGSAVLGAKCCCCFTALQKRSLGTEIGWLSVLARWQRLRLVGKRKALRLFLEAVELGRPLFFFSGRLAGETVLAVELAGLPRWALVVADCNGRLLG
jgi:hypothetical protein